VIASLKIFMFKCPTCGENGITFWAKLWCGSVSPAKCEHCKSLSYVHSKYRHGMQSAWPTVAKVFGLAASIGIFLLTNHVWTLFLFPVIWLACSAWEVAILPMSPMTETESKERKKYSNVFIFLLALLALLIYLQENL